MDFQGQFWGTDRKKKKYPKQYFSCKNKIGKNPRKNMSNFIFNNDLYSFKEEKCLNKNACESLIFFHLLKQKQN